jgi:hypothetical protein
MVRSDRRERDHIVAQLGGTDEDWEGMLDAWFVQFLVLDRQSDDDLLKRYRSKPGWAVDFEDGEAVIFVRGEPAQLQHRRVPTHDEPQVPT